MEEKNVGSAGAARYPHEAGEFGRHSAEPRHRYRRPDDDLLQSIERELLKSGQFDMRDLSIEVQDGCATIRGRVPSGYAREHLNELVSQISDIERIDNQVSVEQALHPESGGSKGIKSTLSRRTEKIR